MTAVQNPDSLERHLVYDRYDVSTSLEGTTRDRRPRGQPVIPYYITGATNIEKNPIEKNCRPM